MFRSLHMKLMLIMTLLIVSLMTVVGAFLINSVANYYTQDFYTQMSEAFADEVFWADLNTPTPGEQDGAASIAEILNAYNGTLGVDNRSVELVSGRADANIICSIKKFFSYF